MVRAVARSSTKKTVKKSSAKVSPKQSASKKSAAKQSSVKKASVSKRSSKHEVHPHHSVFLPWYDYSILVLFSLLAFFAGIPKLLGLEFMVSNMAELGFSKLFTQIIGLFWVLAGVGVWFKKYRNWAALGTVPIIAGAIAAHLTAGAGFNSFLLINILFTGLVLWIGRFYTRI